MNAETLNAAIREAERFLKAAKAAKIDLASEGSITGTKTSGAAKRASLDLTRALADMRRPS